jgi:hypothetical protein
MPQLTRLVDARYGRLAYWRSVVARPDTWLWLVCGAIVGWSASQLLLFGFGRDQSIYAVVGHAVLDGQMPYRDVWDFKPPGIFVVYAAAEALFGPTMWGPRVFEATTMLATACLLVRASRVYFADPRPGLIAAALASLLHVQFEYWHTGQPENFGAFLTVAALSFISDSKAPSSSSEHRKVWCWLGCGVCFGLAFVMKPPLGGGVLVCAALLMKQEVQRALEQGARGIALWWLAVRPALVVGLAALVPLVMLLFWFWVKGAFTELYWTLFVFTPQYTKLGWDDRSAVEAFYLAVEGGLVKHSALLAVGIMAAGFGAAISTRSREGLSLVLGLLAMQFAGIALQAKFFAYHFGASLPLLAFVAGLGWFKIWRLGIQATKSQGGAPGAVAVASLAVVAAMARLPVHDVPFGFWERAKERTKMWLGLSAIKDRVTLDRAFHKSADFDLGADIDVAHRLNELTAPHERIFVWGFEPAIYWLAKRTPASRYVYNAAQRASWGSEAARSALMSDLERNTPSFIVVQHNDVFRFVTGNSLDSHLALSEFPALVQLMEHNYTLLERIEDFDLYRRTAQ